MSSLKKILESGILCLDGLFCKRQYGIVKDWSQAGNINPDSTPF